MTKVEDNYAQSDYFIDIVVIRLVGPNHDMSATVVI